MKLVFALVTGLIFGIGISLSGMINPAKGLGFFDIAGSWDPSLAFVMSGGLAVTFVGYRLAWRRSAPLFAQHCQKPTATLLDRKLIGGSALFGVGWGIAGFCPGAALPALGTGRWEVVLFLVAVIVGIVLHRQLVKPTPASGLPQQSM